MNGFLRALPSLDALKGFDAAARHLSFTRAASELFLTQSAVSRQIQTLEEQLGVRLFVRETRRLRLTPEGEALHRETGGMLARLAEVCAGLRATRQRPRVIVSAAVGIAALWLLPRISAFQAQEPDVDVRLSADNRIVDLEREGFDLALRYFSPETPPPNSTLLFDEVVFPVAHPDIVARLPAVLRAEDFAQITLLVFEGGQDAPWLSWEPWFQAQKLADARPKTVLQFNQYDQMIRAAEDGAGIALGRGPLVERSIAEGRLKPLGDARQHVAKSYFLVRSECPSRPEVERFVDWLLREARETGRDA